MYLSFMPVTVVFLAETSYVELTTPYRTLVRLRVSCPGVTTKFISRGKSKILTDGTYFSSCCFSKERGQVGQGKLLLLSCCLLAKAEV
jgi:hypothetical protein